MSQIIEYIPITMEELEWLKKNSKKQYFLMEFADYIEEEIVCPKIYIGFPSNIKKMFVLFKDELKKIKNEEKCLNNSSYKDKNNNLNNERKNDQSKKNINIKKNDNNESNYTEVGILKGLSIKGNSSGEEKKNNSEIKKEKLNSITYDHSSDSSSDNETTTRRKILPPQVLDDLKLSIINWNKNNINYEDEFSINFDEDSIEKPEVIKNKPKNNKNLTKKFKIKRERYFYMKHKENQPFMDIIQNIINKKHLTYSISPEYFILEAENENNVADLDDSVEQIQELINDQLKFLKGKQHIQSFYAMKMIFHSSEYRDKVDMLKYLKYKHLADKQIEYLIFYFKENKKKALKFQKFLLERDCSKMQIVKMKYNTFVKGKRYKPINERSDFKILKDEGELVSKYFKNYKENDIIKEIKNNDSFKNSDCKFLVFESPMPEREYNTSIVFHWQLDQSLENNNRQVILKYLGSLKKDFYSDNKFCVFRFKKKPSKQFPLADFKVDKDKQSLFSTNNEKNLYKINIFGKANQITQFIDNNINTFIEFYDNCDCYDFILKISNFDNEYIDKNIMSKKWAIEGKIQFNPYKNEDTCQYYCVYFNDDLDFVQILTIIKELLKINFPKKSDDKYYKSFGENKKNQSKDKI